MNRYKILSLIRPDIVSAGYPVQRTTLTFKMNNISITTKSIKAN